MEISQFFKPAVRRYRKPETMLKECPLLSKLVRMQTYRETLPELAGEINRARRYRRPLSVAVMQFEASGGSLATVHVGGNGNGSRNHSQAGYPDLVVAHLLGAILRDTLRETDLVSYDAAGGRYVIMMPELAEAQAQRAVRRLNDLVLASLHTSMRVGVAEFPRDGLTLEEMVASAEESCQPLVNCELTSELKGLRQ